MKLCLFKPRRHRGTEVHKDSVLLCVIVSLWFKKLNKELIVQVCDATDSLIELLMPVTK